MFAAVFRRWSFSCSVWWLWLAWTVSTCCVRPPRRCTAWLPTTTGILRTPTTLTTQVRNNENNHRCFLWSEIDLRRLASVPVVEVDPGCDPLRDPCFYCAECTLDGSCDCPDFTLGSRCERLVPQDAVPIDVNGLVLGSLITKKSVFNSCNWRCFWL